MSSNVSSPRQPDWTCWVFLFRGRLSCSDRLFISIIHPHFVRLCFSLTRFSPVVSVHPSFLCVEAAAGGITRPTGRTGEHGRLSALIGPFSFYSSDFFPLSFSPLSSLLTHTHTPGSISRYHWGAVDKPGCHGNTARQPRQQHRGNFENSPPTTPPPLPPPPSPTFFPFLPGLILHSLLVIFTSLSPLPSVPSFFFPSFHFRSPSSSFLSRSLLSSFLPSKPRHIETHPGWNSDIITFNPPQKRLNLEFSRPSCESSLMRPAERRREDFGVKQQQINEFLIWSLNWIYLLNILTPEQTAKTSRRLIASLNLKVASSQRGREITVNLPPSSRPIKILLRPNSWKQLLNNRREVWVRVSGNFLTFYCKNLNVIK